MWSLLFTLLVGVEAAEPKASESLHKVEVKQSAWEQAEWKAWLETYASSTPLLALRKLRPPQLHITDEHIDQILKGNSKVKFKEPLYIGKIDHKEYEIFNFMAARRFEPFDQIDHQELGFAEDSTEAVQEEERSRFLREQMIQLIKNRKEGELNLILVGQMHAYDLFFRGFLDPDLSKKNPLHRIKDEVAYVGFPVTEETKLYTPEYESFIEAVRGVAYRAPTIKDNSLYLSMGFLARLYYYNNLKSGMIKKESLLQERSVKLGNLVFMNIHFLRINEPYASMPSVQALRDIGVTKIHIALEGWKHGTEYKLEDLKKFYRIKEAGKYSKDDINYFKKFRPKAWKLYESDFVYNQSVQAFHQKLQSYQRAGMEISVSGLESSERF